MESISPIYARFVLRELERNEIDTGPLFASRTLTREKLLRGGDIAMDDFLHILATGQALSGDEQLGLMIGRHSHLITLGEVGAAMAVAPTIREGLQILESFTRLHTSYVQVKLNSTLDGLALQLHFRQDIGETERFHIEAATLLLQHYVEMISGLPLEDGHFHLGMPRPPYAIAYDNYMHSPISFDNDISCVELPRHWLDLPSPYYNALMWQQFRRQLSQQLSELIATEKNLYTQHISAWLRSSEPPLPDLAAAAASLYTTERTLNRRLQAESTSFRQLKTEAVISRAKLYLSGTGDSVEAIAAALGYQDTANFRRAFRKHEGCSPGEFRETQLSSKSTVSKQ